MYTANTRARGEPHGSPAPTGSCGPDIRAATGSHPARATAAGTARVASACEGPPSAPESGTTAELAIVDPTSMLTT